MAPKKSNPKAKPRGRSVTRKSAKPARSRAPSRSRSRSVSVFDKAKPRIEGHAAGGTISMYRMINPKVSKLPSYLKTTQEHSFGAAESQLYASAQGQQGCSDVNTYFDTADLQTFATQIQNYLLNGASPAVLPNTANMKIFLDHITGTNTFRNNTNNEMILDIYDITPRHDMTNQYTPQQAWNTGNLDGGGSGGMIVIPGASPFQAALFTELFVVKKVTNCILPAGSTHEHKFHYAPRRVFNMAELGGAYWFKGLTQFQMVVFRGSPTLITEGQLVTVGAVQLLSTSTYTAYFRYLAGNQQTINVINTLRSGTDQFINDVTGLTDTTVF